MTAIHSTIIDRTALSGPALRLHLLELYLTGNDMPDQALPMAQAAEQWILGASTVEPLTDAEMEELRAEIYGQAAAPANTQQAATLDAIRQAAAAGDVITSVLVAERIGCSLPTARKYIGELVDAGLVVNHGTRTSPKYALADQPAPVAELDGYTDPVDTAPQPVITRKPAADPAPAMPARAVLPEDKLRQTPEAASHVNMETVAQWLRANGCKSLTEEAPGCWSLEGAVLSDKDLLKRANKARKTLNLPSFSVRGV